MKVHLPIVGKASGSSAGLIYQSYWGNTYTRSFPFSFHYPDTSKQQKCQFDFFKIQRVWWAIYSKLKEFIPKVQRRNKNVYDVLSDGLYSSFMTYTEKAESNVRTIWGLDERKSVKALLSFEKITNAGKNYYITATLQAFVGKRKFSPKLFHVLLCNITRQDVLYTFDYYTSSHIKTQIEVYTEWQRNDLIVAYIAFSNDEFFTNFYLCGQ